MSRDGAATEYGYDSVAAAHNHSYLAPALLGVLGPGRGRRLLDIGCGNGSLTSRLASGGFSQITGIESSASALALAMAAQVQFKAHDINDPLPADMRGMFDVVVSAEVIEHLFLPRMLFYRAAEALDGRGMFVVSTPYHGYAKNLALALTGKFDHHWRPSWDYGHIKFFSVSTLGAMATECGFEVKRVLRVGRIPALAKTMVIVMESTSP